MMKPMLAHKDRLQFAKPINSFCTFAFYQLTAVHYQEE